MRLSLLASLLLAAALPAFAQGTPKITTVEPDSGKRGDVITITGENLGKDSVAKLLLTDGNDKNDVEVTITEQTATSIKFKLPVKGGAGRLALLVLTASKPAQYIEEPYKVTINDGTGQ
jgi:hypothetical protein